MVFVQPHIVNDVEYSSVRISMELGYICYISPFGFYYATLVEQPSLRHPVLADLANTAFTVEWGQISVPGAPQCPNVLFFEENLFRKLARKTHAALMLVDFGH